MSDNKPSNEKDPSKEDDDFGLPEVNFTPIGSENKDKDANVEEVPPPVPVGEEKLEDTGEDEKTGSPWLFILIFLLLAGFGMGLYYLGVFENFSINRTSQQDTELPQEEDMSVTDAVPQVEETDSDEPEEIILTEITSKEAAPRYFVVVGSFIDDDLAKDYSAKLNKSGLKTYLIHPYGNIDFYRLAVNQHDNVTDALSFMEGIKADFEENLWVLKY